MSKHTKESLGDQPAVTLTKREYVAVRILAALVPLMGPKAGPMAIVGRTMALTEHLLAELANVGRPRDDYYDDELVDLGAEAADPDEDRDLPY